MPLKYQLDSLDGLDDGVKELYTEKDGKFVLGVDGLPEPEDVSGLKAKLEQLMDEKKAAARKTKEAEDAAEAARLEAAKKSGDTEALEKSWSEKLSARESELQAQIDELSGTVTNLTSGQTATKLASEIALQGSADVLLPHIQGRLKTEYKDGQARTVVLDKDGKPSALTVDELKAEFQNNPAFAPLIVGSKATGGGANSGNHGGGAAGKNLKEMSHREKSEYISEHGLDAFNSLVNKGN